MGMQNPIKARNQRGSVMIIAMIMVSLLAALTLSYAMRITSDEGRMEVDLAASYALEIAESANNWNQQRVFNAFDTQNFNYKLGTTTTAAIPWLKTVVRTTGTANPMTYDFVNGGTSFDTLWQNSSSFQTWGPGQVKVSVKLLQLQTSAAAIAAGQQYQDASGHYSMLEFKSWARFPDAMLGRMIDREVRRIIKFSTNGNNKVYDFAYFANNYGWMYGTPIYISGSMGSNGDIGFSGNPTVNGDLYAAANGPLGAPGNVNGTYLTQTLASYLSNPSGMAASDPAAWNNLVLPGNPAYKSTNAAGQTTQIDFNLGFGGTSTKNQKQTPLDMPYLGDLSYYKQEANAFNRPANSAIADTGGVGGVVKQLKAPGLDPTVASNYNVIINSAGGNASYGDNTGENGMYTTWQTSGAAATSGISVGLANMTKPLTDIPGKQALNGNLALVGTPEQPIVISGPVVVNNDLVIRGVVKGQGTFFVGRNVHVVGDITYSSNPNWRDPTNSNNATNISNPNFLSNVSTNDSADLVGFAVKGSVVLGQYNRNDDSWNTCKSTYFNTGFQDGKLESYQIDPTDRAIGYVNSTYNSNPTFAGNYTQYVQLDVPACTAFSSAKTAYVDANNGAVPDATTTALKVPFMLRYPDVANWDDPRPDHKPIMPQDVAPDYTQSYSKGITFMNSVFPDDYIQKLSTAGTGSSGTTNFLGPGNASNVATNAAIVRPATISGIYYTNHLFGGRIGNNSYGVKIYGTMVARDEGCVFNTKCQFTYDPRVSTKNPSSHVNIYIPQGTAFQQVAWEEVTPGQ